MSTQKRTNSWTQDEDLLLVEVVLRSIRNKQKMKLAFREAEHVVGRSAGACQFRWSTELSKKYEASVEQAKVRVLLSEEKITANGEKAMTSKTYPSNNSVAVAMHNAFAKENRSVSSGSTGKQQVIDFPSTVKPETSPKELDSPFLRIRRFAKKLEREYGDVFSKHDLLQQEVVTLSKEIALIRKERDESLEEVLKLQQSLEQANKDLASFAEIKQLIEQFNELG